MTEPRPLVARATARCLALLLSLLAACSAESLTDSESSDSRMTGSEAKSLSRITLRNAIVTQPFDPDLLAPDGRLGLQFLGGAQVRISALGDPSVTIAAGA